MVLAPRRKGIDRVVLLELRAQLVRLWAMAVMVLARRRNRIDPGAVLELRAYARVRTRAWENSRHLSSGARRAHAVRSLGGRARCTRVRLSRGLRCAPSETLERSVEPGAAGAGKTACAVLLDERAVERNGSFA